MQAFEPSAFDNDSFEVGYVGQYLPHKPPFRTVIKSGVKNTSGILQINSSTMTAKKQGSQLKSGISDSDIDFGD